MARRVRGISGLKAEFPDDDSDEDYDESPGDSSARRTAVSPWDLQGNHSSRTASNHYGIHENHDAAIQPSLLGQYEKISRLWHLFPDPEAYGTTTYRKRASTTTESSGNTKRPNFSAASSSSLCTRLHYVDVMAGLKRLFGPDAMWQAPVQLEAFCTICDLRNDEAAICVLPTGLGKSVLYMLFAAIESPGTTVVILPFNALLDDIYNKARAKSIDCAVWRPRPVSAGQQRAPRLLLVTADQASSEGFTALLDSIAGQSMSQRIFIDETHTVLVDADYRTSLNKLPAPRRYPVPLVMLSATLPPSLEQPLLAMMRFKEAKVVRTSITGRTSNTLYTRRPMHGRLCAHA